MPEYCRYISRFRPWDWRRYSKSRIISSMRTSNISSGISAFHVLDDGIDELVLKLGVGSLLLVGFFQILADVGFQLIQGVKLADVLGELVVQPRGVPWC